MILITSKIILLTWLISLFSKQSNNLYCGIVGFAGFAGNTFKADKIKYLLHINQERGKDATGIWDKINGLQKNVEKAEDFVINPEIKWEEGSNILIGHCRAGSSGAKTNLQAHPHETTNIVGVHNGTLRELYELSKNYNLGNFNLIANSEKKGETEEDFIPKFQVPTIASYHENTDSQLLYKIMDGSKSTQVLSYIDGSAALLFHDKNVPDTVYAYRKDYTYAADDRPLFYGTYISKNKKEKTSGIYFSSIEKSLKLIGCENITTVKTGCVSVFKNGVLVDEIKIDQYKLNTTTTTSNNYSHNHYNHYNQQGNNVGYDTVNNFVTPISLESLKRLQDRWILLNRPNEIALRDKWVYVLPDSAGVASGLSIKVRPEDSEKEYIVHTTDVHFCSPKLFLNLKVGDDVVLMTNIVSRHDKTEYLFTTGEVVKIDRINDDGTITVDSRSYPCSSGYTLNTKYFRKAQDIESNLYHLDNKNNVQNDNEEYCITKCMILTNKAKKLASNEGYKSKLLTYYSENASRLNLTIERECFIDTDETIENLDSSWEATVEKIFSVVDNSKLTSSEQSEIKDKLCELTENFLILNS